MPFHYRTLMLAIAQEFRKGKITYREFEYQMDIVLYSEGLGPWVPDPTFPRTEDMRPYSVVNELNARYYQWLTEGGR